MADNPKPVSPGLLAGLVLLPVVFGWVVLLSPVSRKLKMAAVAAMLVEVSLLLGDAFKELQHLPELLKMLNGG